MEAVIQGSPSAVEKMLDWCRTGTPPARVDYVEEVNEDLQEIFNAFSIL